MFPMPGGRRREPMHWWSPEQRGVLPLDGLRLTRSLRQAHKNFEIRVDSAFEDVLAACADPRRPDGWIDARIRAAYTRLHRLGWAHSVEAWQDGVLVGGLYGVTIGGLFAGESMFHHVTDASKVALVALTEIVFADDDPRRLIDVQWATPHLESLGICEVLREDYCRRLAAALPLSLPEPWRSVRDDVAVRVRG
jgi:leucyl/phenylalanyl-tRNA--protein transferase